MDKVLKLCLAALLVASLSIGQASAAMYGLPSAIRKQFTQVTFDQAVLPPFAYSRFCVHYAEECHVHGFSFRRPKPVVLTAERMQDLVEINRTVNRRIIPTAYLKANFYDSWSIAPKRGDCNDFAVTKRHELLARGWPSRALLLAEVIVPDGEHHMVLLVRTSTQDIVLDNLTPSLRTWSETPYQWVRVQSPFRPMMWSTVRDEQAV